ncbi:MAG: MarR family winged helix-turn-helix transcriptional regulator [Firmicutes bacterium]|nr:MarR family winged helix-turn-helix transcriptional regulator [Bacillota bacterium]
MDIMQELDDLWQSIDLRMKREIAGKKYTALQSLNAIELDILQIAEKQPKGMMKDVCEQLQLAKSTLTSAVNRLESKGFIIKDPDAEDGRACNLTLTKLGMQVRQEHRRIKFKVFMGFCHALSVKEKEILMREFSEKLKKRKLRRQKNQGGRVVYYVNKVQ